MAVGWNTCRPWASEKVRKALHEVLCSHQAGSWLWELLSAPRLSCHQLLVNSCLLVLSQPCNNHSHSRSGKQSLVLDACRLMGPMRLPMADCGSSPSPRAERGGTGCAAEPSLGFCWAPSKCGQFTSLCKCLLVEQAAKTETRCQSFLLFNGSVYVTSFEIWIV